VLDDRAYHMAGLVGVDPQRGPVLVERHQIKLLVTARVLSARPVFLECRLVGAVQFRDDEIARLRRF